MLSGEERLPVLLLWRCIHYRKFTCLPQQMVTILKQNGLYLNSLKPGHILKQCPSIHRCPKCQRPHHTWLHLDKEADPQRQTSASPSSLENTPGNVTSQSSDCRGRVLLTTCQVRVIASGGSTTNARVLLSSVSSTSFVTECLAQHLHLRCQYRRTQISGIGGINTH